MNSIDTGAPDPAPRTLAELRDRFPEWEIGWATHGPHLLVACHRTERYQGFRLRLTAMTLQDLAGLLEERVDDSTRPAEEHRADELFDALSSHLREHRADHRLTKEQLRAALIAADEMFQSLHEWITRGGPLPGPWREHYTPRGSSVPQNQR